MLLSRSLFAEVSKALLPRSWVSGTEPTLACPAPMSAPTPRDGTTGFRAVASPRRRHPKPVSHQPSAEDHAQALLNWIWMNVDPSDGPIFHFAMLEHYAEMLLERGWRELKWNPVAAYLGGLDSHKTSDVRSGLAPLQQLAAETGAAVVLISHLNKGSADGNAMARVAGSGAFVAACRSAWLVEADPQDESRKRRILTPLKNNSGDDQTGFAFQIKSVQLPDGLESSCIVFEPDTWLFQLQSCFAGTKKLRKTAASAARPWTSCVITLPPVQRTQRQRRKLPKKPTFAPGRCGVRASSSR